MNNLEIKTFLTSDYIYIPYVNMSDIHLNENKYIYKGETLINTINKKICSPVSGLAYGLSEINSTKGIQKVLIIENDFKDKVLKKLISIKDIYKLDSEKIIVLTNHICNKKNLILNIDYDLNNEYLLKDNIIEILETLNIIDLTYKELNVKIRLDKKDITSYRLLFSYLGTYPNIEIEFIKSSEDETIINIYETLDIYNNLKNRIARDFVYISVKHNNQIQIIKTKKYSNLKDLLVHLNLISTNIIINDKIKIESANFLLDDTIKTINIK